MANHTLTVTVSIEVQSNLSYEELVDHFGSEVDYTFNSLEGIEVLNTEILEVE